MNNPLPDPIVTETFDRLHPEAISDPSKIDRLLDKWMKSGALLRQGTNHAVEVELATVIRFDTNSLALRCKNFEAIGQYLLLSTEYHGIPYFFSVEVLRTAKFDRVYRYLLVSKPAVIYRAERRDRPRLSPASPPECVTLRKSGREVIEAQIVDRSGDGLGVFVRDEGSLSTNQEIRIEGLEDQPERWAIVRSRSAVQSRPGWTRVGLSVLPARPGTEVPMEKAEDVLSNLGGTLVNSKSSLFPEQPKIIEFYDSRGEKLVGILDRYGNAEGAPVIVVPSAWGKTKETLAGLAGAILATFSSARRPVSIFRFDGIRKRGESHNDPECRKPGLENLNYTFSQGAADLLSTAQFLRREYGYSKVIVASFSVASIEARRAIAVDRGDSFDGWISIVGATDPQSLIRIISGGIDYLAGAEKGIKFGRQDVQGMLLDIDHTAEDALANRIAFLDDARRDFSTISCPISWIIGVHDAWMSRARVTDALSFGPSEQRRIILAETGHQLRDSKVAAEIFALIASECVRMSDGGESVRPMNACPQQVKKRIVAERKRLRGHRQNPDLRLFWKDYLVGRQNTLGMDLVTETSTYRALLRDQIEALQISRGDTIVDLGSGLSTFARVLLDAELDHTDIRVISIDLIHAAMCRGRSRLPPRTKLHAEHVVADLSMAADGLPLFPLLPKLADRAVASLLLNYLSRPEAFLQNTYDILKPGGKMVLTALRHDADTSKICVDGISELRTGRGLASFGGSNERLVDQALRDFINDAALLLDFEERGIFRFWSQDELRKAMESAAFERVSISPTFGTPPQAWLVTATRPI